jgi:dihydropteroate synthase
MPALVARREVPFVVMHWRGPSSIMDSLAQYGDVVTDVVRELGERVEALLGAGVRREQLVVDPGLGFAKGAGHNWTLLHRLRELQSLGLPVLVGASRKRFLGTLLAAERDAATAATSVLAAAAGAWCVRVHDVPGTAAAVRVVAAASGAGR